jgi:PAS domain S-box-containing protein
VFLVKDHLLQLYEDDRFLVERVARHLAEGAALGEPAVVIATPAHRAALAGLAPAGVRFLDAADTLAQFMADGTPDPARFEAVVGGVVRELGAGGRRVRAFGEMVALLWADGRSEAALALEELWNGLGQRHQILLLCAYPMDAFGGASQAAAFLRVCAAHGETRPSEAFPPEGADRGRYVAHLQQQARALAGEAGLRARLAASLAERERELADFCENAVEGLHKVGADGRILWANQAQLDLLGYTRDEYVGRPMAEFHADPAVLEGVLERLRRGEAVTNQPIRLRAKDGTIRHLMVYSNAHHEDGKLAYTRCFMRDVTDSMRLEQERVRRMEELADADRRKDQFIGMLAHELRNPLAPILMASELVRRNRADPDKVLAWTATIERQANQMRRLVEDLLDVSRITSGSFRLQRAPVPLHQVVETAIEQARPVLESRGHAFARDIPPDPVLLLGDGARLAQMVGNLLHNAAKFTPAGGRVRLLARVHEHDGGQDLALEVEDSGIGIPPEARTRIFEPFVQAAASPDQGPSGLGIGLAVVRRIAELHDGTVVADSPGAGQGSTFRVVIPLPAQPAPPTAADPRRPAGAGRRVLVVDDNPDVAASLQAYLEAEGHRVRTRGDGASALAAVAAEPPEVAILDIGLPGMDGHELARRIRIACPETELVALSGYAQAADQARSRAAGFQHHLAKPPDLARLLGILAPRRAPAIVPET